MFYGHWPGLNRVGERVLAMLRRRIRRQTGRQTSPVHTNKKKQWGVTWGCNLHKIRRDDSPPRSNKIVDLERREPIELDTIPRGVYPVGCRERENV